MTPQEKLLEFEDYLIKNGTISSKGKIFKIWNMMDLLIEHNLITKDTVKDKEKLIILIQLLYKMDSIIDGLKQNIKNDTFKIMEELFTIDKNDYFLDIVAKFEHDITKEFKELLK